MAHLNYYNDGVNDLMEVNEVSNFDYIPGTVIKSNSLTSNECLTSRSSFDEVPATSSRPSTGLKLVLKRQSQNNYEVKNNCFESQCSNDSWNVETPVSNVLPNGKRIPRRQSARKVKFIFSDEEFDDQIAPSKKKRTSIKTNKKTSQANELEAPAQVLPMTWHQKLTPDSDDDEESIFQDLLLKNMPQTNLLQQQLFQNQLILNSINNIQMPFQNSITKNNNSSTRTRNKSMKAKQDFTEIDKSKRVTKKKTPKKAKPKTKTTNKYTSKPASIVSKPKTDRNSLDEKECINKTDIKENLFSEADIVKSNLLEKHRILNNQPMVLMEHSKPFPIALVEDVTNIVETKALLFLHLFQSFSCPCIGCPQCKDFMTCTEFSTHIHLDDEDNDNEAASSSPQIDPNKPRKSYKILPYRVDNEELSESDLKTWKEFGKRYIQFKQTQKKTVEQKQQTEKEAIQKPNPKLDLNNNQITALDQSQEDGSNKFTDWDSTENGNFLISNQRLESDQVCIVNTEASDLHDKENIHYFMEQQEDLLLSEDESEDQEDLDLNPNKDSTNKSTEIDVELVMNDILEQIENKTNMNLIKFEAVKQNLKSSRVLKQEKIESIKPTILERYFNLYDNLTNDMLLYICDNEITVIPDSYVLYMNNKREMNSKELKLANTDYYQSKWLEQSLDLECSRSRLE